jgi:CBS domain-containing protein
MSRDISSKLMRRIVTIDENRSALEAAMVMTEEFIGSVVVTRSSKIIGIFTERDLMMKVVGKRKDPDKVKIKDVMIEGLITVGPKDTAGYCLI